MSDTATADRHAERLALVSRLYALTGASDWAAAAAHLTDDFFVTEADGLPFAGVYSGKDALRELYTTVMGMMDIAGMEIHGTTIGGDYAVTLVDFIFPGPDGGRARIAEMFRFRGEQVCEIRPYYFDPAPVIAAVAAKRAALAAK